MNSSPTSFLLSKDLGKEALERLLSQPEVALDTETLGLNPWRDPLCLVQICDPKGNVNMVRTTNWKQAEGLKTFLRSPVVKVIHNALFDCCMLLTNTGTEVNNPYCTKIASKLSRTYGNNHSLAGLAKELLSVELDKTQQISDWSAELTEAQLRYASADVTYLLEIKQKLELMLERRRPLQSGILPVELNRQAQATIPTLVQLKVNGWNIEGEGSSLFGY